MTGKPASEPKAEVKPICANCKLHYPVAQNQPGFSVCQLQPDATWYISSHAGILYTSDKFGCNQFKGA